MYWVALTAGAGFILPAILFFWRRRKPKSFKIKELARNGIPEESVAYEVVDLNIPRLSGKAMVIVKRLCSITFIKNILGAQSIRQSKLDLLRSIDIPDCPTITPLPLETWNPPPVDDRPIDFEKYLKTARRSKSSPFKFLSIAELTRAYRNKEVTPSDVANNIIQGIRDSEKRTPKMNIFTQYDPDEIRKLAKASTKRYEKNKPLSFLDGVPVGLKEEFDVIPYYMQNGTTFWSSKSCKTDASLVKKLRDGGAMIIGMTNMHEIGIGVTGNNAHSSHGTPRNPYNVNHYTGGSSSGSAAAVASGLCLVALGTDGGGSIRMPSGACGVVGIKASYGRINTAGVVHTCHTVTHAGPICNSVNDAAIVYGKY
ncbi:fatty acid amide hydrolase-like [Actinia tenebrosa]|uniref:Fatty acid amide hydrolase-like n=1 Tax=Actinia tenebrosa TaxID=6105 RepID=A0A6P8HTB6_ACTTE|nr:fatty acid amide hydrolase-like [Actinia tenebrosa]XP_031559638.1 fatty acid amide hydrolase-like [Actinia tenebrosa]XP_031559639.1 fatty acid amide hydrolase-like [Actinia tenebrosa]